MIYFLVFFFSSRRRHTRWTGDWSSDVCSSDLAGAAAERLRVGRRKTQLLRLGAAPPQHQLGPPEHLGRGIATEGVEPEIGRSEERRVGKEWRSRRSACH